MSETGRDSAARGAARAAAILAVVLVLSWFGSLGYRALTSPDEGRYAEIAREMSLSGDWVTPRYNGVKYFEKPVLLYWATATAFALFGESEWAARLWVGLTAFGGVVLSYAAGTVLLGPRAALCGAAVLASAPLWIISGQLNTTDMGVAFFLHAAVCAFLLAQRGSASPPASRRFMLACWAAMALAVLSKGLIGIALPGLALAAYVAATRDFGLLARLHIRTGLPVFAAISAPWFVVVSIRNPEFPGFFFIHEHFGRYTVVEGYNRSAPWWYFLAILAIGMLPWTFAACRALVSALGTPAVSPNGVPPRRLLALWIVVVVGFFSFSSSKLPGYVVPAIPAIAMLAGATIAAAPRTHLRWLFGGSLAAAASALLLLHVPDFVDPRYAPYRSWLLASAALAATGSLLALGIQRWPGSLPRPMAPMLLFAFFGYAAFLTAVLGHDSLRARFSAYDLAAAVSKHIDHGEPFYAVGTLDHTLPFYTKKILTPVVYEDELAFGLALEPQLGLREIDEFQKRWREGKAPMALMDPPTYERLEKMGLPMRVVARDARRVVVAKELPGMNVGGTSTAVAR